MADLRNLSSKYDIPGGYGNLGSSTYNGMQSQFGPSFYQGWGGFNGTPKQNDPHVKSLDGAGYFSIPASIATAPFGGSAVIVKPPILDNFNRNVSNPTVSSYFAKSGNTYVGGIGPNDGFY